MFTKMKNSMLSERTGSDLNEKIEFHSMRQPFTPHIRPEALDDTQGNLIVNALPVEE